jgi:hypothetical protein
MKFEAFDPTVCEHCLQTTNYCTQIDRGIADIMRAFAIAIRTKGINLIHPVKEMQADAGTATAEAVAWGKLTRSMGANLSRARYHGLLARSSGKKGNWMITRKGIDFLSGRPIPRVVIIDKITGSTMGYFNMEEDQVTINKITKENGPYWTEMIHEGRVIPATEYAKPQTV